MELLPAFVAFSAGSWEQVSCCCDNKASEVGQMFPFGLQGFTEDVSGEDTWDVCPWVLLPDTLIYSDALHLVGGWPLFSVRKQTLMSWLLSPGSHSGSRCFMYEPSETSMSCSAQIQAAPALQSSCLHASGTARPYNTRALSTSLGCSVAAQTAWSRNWAGAHLSALR